MGLADLFALSARTGGPVHLATAAAATGLAVRTLRRHAADQGWWRPYPGVIAPPGTPQTPWTRARAAAVHLGAARDPQVLAALAACDRRPELVGITGWTAAHLRGVHHAAPTRVQVVLPHGRRVEPHRHLDVRVSRSLCPDQIRWEHQVPLVTPARMLQDLAGVCQLDRLLALLIDLRRGGEVELVEIGRLLATTRFPGCGVLRAAVEMLASAGRTDSIFELRARRRLTAEHVPLDRGQVAVPTPIGPIHLDLGLQVIRFGIDTDGFGYHATREVIAQQSRRHLGLPWPLPQHVRG